MDVEAISEQGDHAPRLRQLQEEHSRYAKQLELLSGKVRLSEEERLEEVRLKKLKLRLKDQISALSRERSSSISSH